MQQLYQAKDRVEAQLLRDYLADSGVEAVVLGDYLNGAAGELPAMQFPVIWLVHDGDRYRAERLLKQFQHLNREASEADWRCAVCGELSEGQFAICWQCGAERPDIEL